MELNRILDYMSRYWLIALMTGIFLYFSLKPEEKRLIIVESYDGKFTSIKKDDNEDPFTIDLEKSHNHTSEQVTKNDPRVSSIWKKGNTFIINNSYNTLYLEEVSYTSNSSYSNSFPTKYTITGNSTYATDKSVSYIFKEPPSSIRVKSGGTITKWHLHK